MAVQPAIVGSVLHLDVAGYLAWQVQPIDRAEDTVEEWVTH